MNEDRDVLISMLVLLSGKTESYYKDMDQEQLLTEYDRYTL